MLLAPRLTNPLPPPPPRRALAPHRTAAQLLALASDRGFDVSQTVCRRLLRQLVSHCDWAPSATVAAYMVTRGHAFSPGDREMFFIMGGLMRDAAGVERALRLMTLITDHRRGDLAGMFRCVI